MTVPVKTTTNGSDGAVAVNGKDAQQQHHQAGAKKQSHQYIKPTPENASSYRPTHDGLLKVVIQGNPKKDGEEGDSFSSFLVAEKDIPANSTITPLSVGYGLTRGIKAYSSVQHGTGENDHFELNSDLLFINHSCHPNVAFDLSEPAPNASNGSFPSSWHLKSLSRPIRAGEPLTFFYPSTEWDMSQGFECQCGEKDKCLGWIRGAKDLPKEQLDAQEWVNPHIWELKQRQQQEQEQER